MIFWRNKLCAFLPFGGLRLAGRKRGWISIHSRIRTNTIHLSPWMVFVRELYWFKHFKNINMKKIPRCLVEGEIQLGEDSSQQNHTVKYFGKYYYWGTFRGVCFFWECTLNSPEWELRRSVCLARPIPYYTLRTASIFYSTFLNLINPAQIYGLVAANRENKIQGRKVRFLQTNPRGCTDNFFFRYRNFFRPKKICPIHFFYLNKHSVGLPNQSLFG